MWGDDENWNIVAKEWLHQPASSVADFAIDLFCHYGVELAGSFVVVLAELEENEIGAWP